jgi:nucleoside-diphosphate-sugar epimerase
VKFIITGDSGFIGKPLAQRLSKEHEVLGISRSNIKTDYKREILNLVEVNPEVLKKVVEDFQPDAIFHLAGYALVKNYSWEVTQNNIIPLHKVLEVVPKECQLIFASSATVYGYHTTPRKVGDDTKPDSIYAETKLFCEKLIQKYHTVYNKLDNFKILRFCAHVAAESTHGLVHDIYLKLKSDNPVLELFGNMPGARKPFLWIDDSVSSIIESLNLPSGTYNLCPNGNLTVQEVATTIMAGLNIQKQIKFINGGWLGDTEYVSLESNFPNIRSSKEAIETYINIVKNK